jgi:hypothetical protein
MTASTVARGLDSSDGLHRLALGPSAGTEWNAL